MQRYGVFNKSLKSKKKKKKRFIKMAASVIASPLNNIINKFQCFPGYGKWALSVQFLRLMTQQKKVILDQYLCFTLCPKQLGNLLDVKWLIISIF